MEASDAKALAMAPNIVSSPLGSSSTMAQARYTRARVAAGGGQGEGEPRAPPAGTVRRRDPPLLQHALARRAAPQAQLVLVLGDADAPLLPDEEARDAAPASVGIGLGEDDVDVGD